MSSVRIRRGDCGPRDSAPTLAAAPPLISIRDPRTFRRHAAARPCRFAAAPRRAAPRAAPRPPAASKEDELAALQNYKSGLDDALKAATAAAAAEAAAVSDSASDDGSEPDLPDLDHTNFWSTIKGLPDGQLAVVMCYTSKCLPCKAAKPQVIQWVADAGTVAGYKFALTLPNKDTALAMGIKSSPTFMFFKNGGMLETMRGAGALPSVKAFIKANK